MDPQSSRLRRGVSKSRPSLAALLDGVSFESDPAINFIPLSPTRKSDPYEQLSSVVGSDDILIDVANEDKPKRDKVDPLKRTPSFPFIGLGRESTSGSSVYPHSTSRSRTSQDGGSGSDHSSGLSSAWSTVSNRLFADVVADAVTSTQREPGLFTREYDKLARKHGLQPFPVGHMVEPSSASVSSVSVRKETEEIPKVIVPQGPIGKGTKILNRLLKRTESTKDISERSRRTLGHPLGHKRMSVSDLTGIGRSGKKNHLRGLHLEDMVRLGGVCEFKLPEKMSPGQLLVPPCFHATGSYIFANGMLQLS